MIHRRVINGAKVCSKCGENKTVDNYYLARKGQSTLWSKCKACHKLWSADYNIRCSDKLKAYRKDQYWKNRELRKEQARQYRKLYPERHAECRRGIRYRQRYKISTPDYDRMFEIQNGKCAVCGKPETRINRLGKAYHLSVDHNHETGKVRGLLCYKCNSALGYLGDNEATVLNLLAYVRISN